MSILKFKVGSTLQMIIDYVNVEEACKLCLVKDDGIYLCVVPVPSKSFVLYAEGCDPEDEDDDQTIYDRCRDLVGGDDFVDKVPVEWPKIALDMKMEYLHIKVTEKKLVLVNGIGKPLEIGG